MPSRIFFGNPTAGASPINIALTPVVVQVALLTPNVGYNQPIDLAPVVVHVTPVTPSVDRARHITLTPVVVHTTIPAIDVAVPRNIDLTPVVVHTAFAAPTVVQVSPPGPALTAALFETPGLVAAQQVEAVLGWEMHRYLNRVGSFTLDIPIVEPTYNSEPLSRSVTRGWRVSIVEENVHPLDRLDLDYLMYRGYVEDCGFKLDESGVAICHIEGSLRALELAGRITPTNATYTASTLAAVASDIVGGLSGGISTPTDGTRAVTISFNADGNGEQISGRYQRLLRLGEYARWALRETWDSDALEFVRLDAPPDSGYTLINMEHISGGRNSTFALVGGTPEIRREGRGIVNRIIPFGADVVQELNDEAEAAATLIETRSDVTPTDQPTLTIATQPTVGKLMVIAGRGYEFQSGATSVAGFIGVGANVAAARTAIVAAVNGTDGFNVEHPTVNLANFGDYGLAADTARIIITDPATLGSTTVTFSGSFTDDAGNLGAAGNLGTSLKTVNVPLTLEHATRTTPFAVLTGTNDDGSNYWYLQDATSISRHGLVEMPMHRTDVKNPNATDDASRAAAADILHQLASLELLRHREAKLFFDCPIANGHEVWALPGDTIRVQYTGNVKVDGVVTMWEEFDKDFLVIERHDKSDPSGVRQVSLTLAIPDLPDVEFADIPVFAVTSDNALAKVLTSLGLSDPGGFGEGGSYAPKCCDDDTTTVTDLDPPDDPPIDPWAYYKLEFEGGETGDGFQPVLRVTYDGGTVMDFSPAAADAGMLFREDATPEGARSGGDATDWWDSSTIPVQFKQINTDPLYGNHIGVISFDTSALPTTASIENVQLFLTFYHAFNPDGLPVLLQARISNATFPLGTNPSDYPQGYINTLLAECYIAEGAVAEDQIEFTPTSEFPGYVNPDGPTKIYLVRAGLAAGGEYQGGDP